MQQLTFRRVRFSKEADTWLRVLKSRTGITPNVLCRMAFCLSLNEPGAPDPAKYPEDSEREINKHTLLGDHELAFACLLRQRLVADGVPSSELISDHFRAHVHRGIIVLASRTKGLADLGVVAANVS